MQINCVFFLLAVNTPALGNTNKIFTSIFDAFKGQGLFKHILGISIFYVVSSLTSSQHVGISLPPLPYRKGFSSNS